MELSSKGNGYEESLTTDAFGVLTVEQLPYGAYMILVRQKGFLAFSKAIEVDSEIPLNENVQLRLASVISQVPVTGGTR